MREDPIGSRQEKCRPPPPDSKTCPLQEGEGSGTAHSRCSRDQAAGGVAGVSHPSTGPGGQEGGPSTQRGPGVLQAAGPGRPGLRQGGSGQRLTWVSWESRNWRQPATWPWAVQLTPRASVTASVKWREDGEMERLNA